MVSLREPLEGGVREQDGRRRQEGSEDRAGGYKSEGAGGREPGDFEEVCG